MGRAQCVWALLCLFVSAQAISVSNIDDKDGGYQNALSADEKECMKWPKCVSALKKAKLGKQGLLAAQSQSTPTGAAPKQDEKEMVKSKDSPVAEADKSQEKSADSTSQEVEKQETAEAPNLPGKFAIFGGRFGRRVPPASSSSSSPLDQNTSQVTKPKTEVEPQKSATDLSDQAGNASKTVVETPNQLAKQPPPSVAKLAEAVPESKSLPEQPASILNPAVQVVAKMRWPVKTESQPEVRQLTSAPTKAGVTSLNAAPEANGPFLSIVIPTKGRNTLPETIASLEAQTDGDWEAIVVFDAVPASISANPRVKIVLRDQKTGDGKNGAGAVRNVGFESATGKWVGFVDDDDTLDPNYVKWLKEEAEGTQSPCVIFRMKYQENGMILPPPGATSIEMDRVGISFAIERQPVLVAAGLRFENDMREDWNFLQRISDQFSYKMSEHVAYLVRPSPPKLLSELIPGFSSPYFQSSAQRIKEAMKAEQSKSLWLEDKSASKLHWGVKAGKLVATPDAPAVQPEQVQVTHAQDSPRVKVDVTKLESTGLTNHLLQLSVAQQAQANNAFGYKSWFRPYGWFY